MKNKLVAKFKQLILAVKDGEDNLTLDLDDSKKESIIAELIIPFMQLTNSETVAELATALKMLIEGDENNESYNALVSEIVGIVMEDSEADKVDDELETLVTNTFAVVNTFNALEEDKTNDESAFESFSAEISAYIAGLGNDASGSENNDEASNMEDDEDGGEGEGEGTDSTDASGEGEDGGAGDAGSIEIVSATDEVDDTVWADVNQVELKNILETALNEGAEGAEMAINETFALVRSMEKKSDWQWPHHVVKDGRVVLNTNGLKTCAMFLLKPTSSKNLTPAEKTSVAEHLLKHYKEIQLEAPAKLAKLSDGKESVIMLNIKEDEMKEFGEIFDVEVESVATYVGLMESLLTDLVNSGIIDIKSEDTDFDESVVSVKLDKDQTQELIKYFDIMSADITSILNSEYAQLSYKRTDAQLENSYQEAIHNVRSLEQSNEELEQTISERNEEISNLQDAVDNAKLDRTKFEAIINFIKTIDGVDEGLIGFVNNVIEAEDKSQITYLLKLSNSLMKSGQSKPTFQKVSIINHATKRDFNALDDFIDQDRRESGHDNSIVSEVDSKVNAIADLFD